MTKKQKNTVEIEIKNKYLYLFGLLFLLFGGLSMAHVSSKDLSTIVYSTTMFISGEEYATADGMYSSFVCPCCGNSLETPCCGMAKERRDYIDTIIPQHLSETDAAIDYVKKYGLDSFVDESKAAEIRKSILKKAPRTRPQIAVEPNVYDFGDLSQADGIASTNVELTNNGKRDLTIYSMKSSCGCTSATLTVNGKTSPKFGMHNNPTDWSETLKPKETATLTIYYDPNMHKDLRGPVTRSIKISSNDPIDFQKEVRIEVNQVA